MRLLLRRIAGLGCVIAIVAVLGSGIEHCVSLLEPFCAHPGDLLAAIPQGEGLFESEPPGLEFRNDLRQFFAGLFECWFAHDAASSVTLA